MQKKVKNRTIFLKLNVPLRGFPAGKIIELRADSAGVPLEKYWRHRLTDAKKDNCVEVIVRPPKTAVKPANNKETAVKPEKDKEKEVKPANNKEKNEVKNGD